MSSTRSKVFALIDCNNFYASCERIFNPALNKKPVLVLSNNDGCVVSRSNEAKALGIRMGEPYFKIDALCKRHKVAVFSSNFALYGDISDRVMKTIYHWCPDMEVYSVDEAFVRLDTLAVNPVDYAFRLKEIIFKHIGIPVSIGIAPTKTLAKVATHLAKQNSSTGVYDLQSDRLQQIILRDFPVQEVWGIGRKTAEKLSYMRINTVSQLCEKPTGLLQKKFSIMMTRIVSELKGNSCLSLEETHHKKNIISSRSFGKPVTLLSDVLEAISSYAARACEKARAQHTKAHGVCVYLRTSVHSKTQPFYSASDHQILLFPSNDTLLITRIAHELIKKLFKPHFQYQKAGIVLLNMTTDDVYQADLFADHTPDDNAKMMALIDGVNKKWGSHTLFLAAEGITQSWQAKRCGRSLRYTTCWEELRKV